MEDESDFLRLIIMFSKTGTFVDYARVEIVTSVT